jgi:Uma2 family endonuclease
MTTISPVVETLADLFERLGDVPAYRIRLHPPPGTATEADVLVYPNGEKRLCELIDGVLVENTIGHSESLLAALLIQHLGFYLAQHDIGFVMGADATLRLQPGQVRVPDVSFVSWDRFPNRELPAEPISDMPPDLAVEILSAGNTPGEMDRKLRDFFAAGVRLVWYVDPAPRAVRVYTSVTEVQVLGESDTLDGDVVLPGFQLSIREWFDRGVAAKRSNPPDRSPSTPHA